MAKVFEGVVRGKLAVSDLLEKYADGVGVQGSIQLTRL
jgi:hypothetical protein